MAKLENWGKLLAEIQLGKVIYQEKEELLFAIVLLVVTKLENWGAILTIL